MKNRALYFFKKSRLLLSSFSLSYKKLAHHKLLYTNESLGVKGFTLAEILIVIAIISILSLITSFGLMSWRPNYQLKAAAHELYTNFQKAKIEAVKTNGNVTFSFTVANSSCSAPSSYEFSTEDGQVIIKKTMESGDICISSATLTSGTSGFNSQGLNFGSSGDIKLRHAKLASRVHTLTLSPVGAIKLE